MEGKPDNCVNADSILTLLNSNLENIKIDKISEYKKLVKHKNWIVGPIILPIKDGIKGQAQFHCKWREMTESQNIDKYDNFCIRTGAVSGITVFDLDVKKGNDAFKSLEAIDIPIYEYNRDCIVIETPSGGNHYIFKYDERYKTGTDCFGIKGFDIRNDGGIIYAGKGYEIDEFSYYMSKDFSWDKPDEELWDNFSKLSVKQDIAKKPAKVETQKVIMNKKNISNDKSMSEQESTEQVKESTPISLEILDFVLSKLSIDRWDNFDDWMKIMSIIKYETDDSKEGFELFDKYSQQSNKYDANDIQKKWDSLKNFNATFGSIMKMAKDDNDPKEYKRIYNKVNYCKKKAKISKPFLYEEVSEMNGFTFNDHDVADYFIKHYNNFIYYNDVLYIFNGIYWVKSERNYEVIKILSNEVYTSIKTFLKEALDKADHEDVNENLIKFYVKALKNCEKLRLSSNLENINKAIKSKISISTDIFDKNISLVCFKNGVYDLENDIFREHRKDDYITKCIDYDYKELQDSDEDMILLNSFLSKVIPVKEELDLMLLLCSTTIYSQTLEHFIILTGRGSNGKDTLFTYLMPATIGDNYYKGNITTITSKIKSDLNPALANCHKKNMILFNEPDKNEKVITSNVKDMTGGNHINARGLYSSNTNTQLTCTMFMLANDLPLLDNVDDAIQRRLIVFDFKTLFKDDSFFEENSISEGLNDDGHHYYAKNQYFKTEEFRDRAKLPMMNLLIRNFKKFKANKFLINKIPQSIKDNNNKYMTDSDNFISWFDQEYELTTDKKDVIKMKDLFVSYKLSYLYENLTKADKRKNNYTWFCEHISKHVQLRKYYFKDRKQVMCLSNYKQILKDEYDYN